MGKFTKDRGITNFRKWNQVLPYFNLWIFWRISIWKGMGLISELHPYHLSSYELAFADRGLLLFWPAFDPVSPMKGLLRRKYATKGQSETNQKIKMIQPIGPGDPLSLSRSTILTNLLNSKTNPAVSIIILASHLADLMILFWRQFQNAALLLFEACGAWGVGFSFGDPERRLDSGCWSLGNTGSVWVNGCQSFCLGWKVEIRYQSCRTR